MTTAETTSSRLRFNFGEAGFAALLLIYFGYAANLVTLSGQPPLVWFGSELTIYAMKVGGPAMALVAIASLSGKQIVLLMDAIVSVLIGIALGFGGLFMGIIGGFDLQNFLYVIFGFMFASAGIRNGRDYFILSQYTKETPATRPAERVPARSVDDDPEMASLAERLRKRVSDSTVILPAIGAEPEQVQAKPSLPAEPKINEPAKPVPIPQPQAALSPDGFLASFAKKKDPQS